MNVGSLTAPQTARPEVPPVGLVTPWASTVPFVTSWTLGTFLLRRSDRQRPCLPSVASRRYARMRRRRLRGRYGVSRSVLELDAEVDGAAEGRQPGKSVSDLNEGTTDPKRCRSPSDTIIQAPHRTDHRLTPERLRAIQESSE